MSIDIAIVGIAGRLPGAMDVERYWQNLVDGIDCISHFTDDELAAAGLPDQIRQHPDFVAAEPRVPAMDELDAPLFALTPREARNADPQLRLFLESCHAALENAGYDAFDAPGRVSVFGSTGTPIYLFEHLAKTREPSNQGQLAMLNNGDYFATQVSYRLNLTGPSMTVLTACSSSLLAAHLAARSLESGECDLALAGGSAIELDAQFGYFYADGSVRSRDGACRPFDSSGGGTVFGGGAAVVVLKRLADAVADGDRVLAVIKGTAINNDGSDKNGYGAPSVSGQVACIKQAMSMAGIRPEDLRYVEAHATGTAVGDPIEIAALAQAWQELGADTRKLACPVGSVKANIGHTAQAAGAASLIKLVMSFDRGVIPPSINVTAPLPQLLAEECPLRVSTEPEAWPPVAEQPRYAAISSFGAGGTNVHMVLTEAPPTTPTALTGRDRVVPWSAQTDVAADALAQPLADHLVGTDVYEDSVSTQQRGRSGFRVRRAVVLSGPSDTAALLGTDRSRPRAAAKVAAGGLSAFFAFPGQGSLTPRVGCLLAAEEPRFGAHVAAAFELFGDRGDQLGKLWRECDDAAEISRTDVAQPILFALEWALSRTWLDWGIQPAAVVGHSLGEIVAATAAGVFRPEDAAQVILARGDAMQSMPSGAMCAVFATPEVVLEHLGPDLDVAAINGEREVVVGGDRDAIADLVARLRDAGVRSVPLRTSHAFHSRSMTAARADLVDVFAGVTLSTPELPLVSAALGRVVSQEATDPEFWADQLVQPVRFRDAVTVLAGLGGAGTRQPGRLVVELGPGRALATLVAGDAGAAAAGLEAVAMFDRSRAGEEVSERRTVLTALATAWTRGASVDWAAVDDGIAGRRVPIPGYRYQRQPFWVDAPIWAAGFPAGSALDEQSDTTGPASLAIGEPANSGEGREPVAEPAPAPEFSVLAWTEASRPSVQLSRPGLVVAFLPADRAIARRVLLPLQRIADDVLAVRPGAGYELSQRGGVLKMSDERQLDRLFGELREAGRVPDLLVHAATMGGSEQLTSANVDDQLADGFGSALRLAGVMSRSALRAPLLIVTAQAVDVSGSEALNPANAALLGLVRSWPLEDPSARIRLIDLDARAGEDDLFDELVSDTAAPVIALRGARRWSPIETAFYPPPAGERAVRRKGVYLVTGGTGGLGREVVRALARTGLQPTIALLSRSGATEDPELVEALTEAEDLGCQVKVFTGDVTVPRDVRRVLDVITAQFGALSGVFHLAGVAGDGVVAMRDLSAADAVLAPKTRGTLVLHEALQDRPPLDFWVSFSSRAAVTGLAGSADYAAANAFVDVWSSASTDAETRQLSIGWPSWAETGMAVPGLRAAGLAPSGADSESSPATAASSAEPNAGELTYRIRLDPDEYWPLGDHRFNGLAVLPGSGHVDLVIRAFRDVAGLSTGSLRVRDFAFGTALAIEAPTDCAVTFQPEAAGYRFQVRSGPQGDTVHSTGRIEELADVMRRQVDIDVLVHSMPAGQPTARLDEDHAFSFGPRWDCVDSEALTDDRVLVELRLADEFAGDLATHPMHPAMLDWSTSGARLASDGPFVPFMYGSLVVHEDLPTRFWSSIRRTRWTDEVITADIDLIAPSGLVLAEIRDFTMRPFTPSAFEARPEVGQEAAGPDADGTGIESAGGRQPSAAPGRGLTTRSAVGYLWRLLDARTPPHVIVRPHVDGRPEPLASIGHRPVESDEKPLNQPADQPTGLRTDPPLAAPSPDAAPVDALARMRQVWVEVLGAVEIESDDDFFDIGGTSLSAIEMVARIREEFAVDMSIATLLDAPTLAGLVSAVSSD